MVLDRKLLGYKGEELACYVMKERGYEIIARNYITKLGEIDIIYLQRRSTGILRSKDKACRPIRGWQGSCEYQETE